MHFISFEVTRMHMYERETHREREKEGDPDGETSFVIIALFQISFL